MAQFHIRAFNAEGAVFQSTQYTNYDNSRPVNNTTYTVNADYSRDKIVDASQHTHAFHGTTSITMQNAPGTAALPVPTPYSAPPANQPPPPIQQPQAAHHPGFPGHSWQSQPGGVPPFPMHAHPHPQSYYHPQPHSHYPQPHSHYPQTFGAPRQPSPFSVFPPPPPPPIPPYYLYGGGQLLDMQLMQAQGRGLSPAPAGHISQVGSRQPTPVSTPSSSTPAVAQPTPAPNGENVETTNEAAEEIAEPEQPVAPNLQPSQPAQLIPIPRAAVIDLKSLMNGVVAVGTGLGDLAQLSDLGPALAQAS